MLESEERDSKEKMLLLRSALSPPLPSPATSSLWLPLPIKGLWLPPITIIIMSCSISEEMRRRSHVEI